MIVLKKSLDVEIDKKSLSNFGSKFLGDLSENGKHRNRPHSPP